MEDTNLEVATAQVAAEDVIHNEGASLAEAPSAVMISEGSLLDRLAVGDDKSAHAHVDGASLSERVDDGIAKLCKGLISVTDADMSAQVQHKGNLLCLAYLIHSFKAVQRSVFGDIIHYHRTNGKLCIIKCLFKHLRRHHAAAVANGTEFRR